MTERRFLDQRYGVKVTGIEGWDEGIYETVYQAKPMTAGALPMAGYRTGQIIFHPFNAGYFGFIPEGVR